MLGACGFVVGDNGDLWIRLRGSGVQGLGKGTKFDAA